MRIVFMGTPEIAAAVLQSLLDSRHEVAAVVTQPDRPKGRGHAVQFPPVKELALSAGIPVLQPPKVRRRAAVEELRTFSPDLIAVVAFGQILPESILSMPRYGCINVHASLLPKYRGAAPIQWAVIRGEEWSGVTTMQMDRGIDTGDILLNKAIRLDPKETADSLHDRLSLLAGPLLLETIDALEAGTLKPRKQEESESSYAPVLTKKDGALDFSEPAVSLEARIRGLISWPGAYAWLNGRMLKIWEAQASVPDKPGGIPGEIVSVGKDHLLVQTGDGCLDLLSVQPEGKRRMDISSYLRGYPVRKGMLLTGPKGQDAGQEMPHGSQ